MMLLLLLLLVLGVGGVIFFFCGEGKIGGGFNSLVPLGTRGFPRFRFLVLLLPSFVLSANSNELAKNCQLEIVAHAHDGIRGFCTEWLRVGNILPTRSSWQFFANSVPTNLADTPKTWQKLCRVCTKLGRHATNLAEKKRTWQKGQRTWQKLVPTKSNHLSSK